MIHNYVSYKVKRMPEYRFNRMYDSTIIMLESDKSEDVELAKHRLLFDLSTFNITLNEWLNWYNR